MQKPFPTSRYLRALNEGTHQPDDVQKEAVGNADRFIQALTAKNRRLRHPAD